MKSAAAYLFVFPALLFLLLFALAPMAQILFYSLSRYSVFQPSEYAGLVNFQRLMGDPSFWWTLGNSLMLILVTPVLILVSLSLALSVRHLVSAGKFLRALYFLPVVTPIVIVGIIWRWIFAEDTGLANYFAGLFGFPQIPWLTVYPVNMLGIMIVTVWRGAGYYMMIFLAGLAAIPREVEEASVLDGASRLQQACYILVPLLKPTLTFVFVISATAAIKTFTEIYIMIPGAPMANKTLVAYLYQQAFERFDLGYGSAIAVVVFLLTLGFSYINVRLLEGREK